MGKASVRSSSPSAPSFLRTSLYNNIVWNDRWRGTKEERCVGVQKKRAMSKLVAQILRPYIHSKYLYSLVWITCLSLSPSILDHQQPKEQENPDTGANLNTQYSSKSMPRWPRCISHQQNRIDMQSQLPLACRSTRREHKRSQRQSQGLKMSPVVDVYAEMANWYLPETIQDWYRYVLQDYDDEDFVDMRSRSLISTPERYYERWTHINSPCMSPNFRRWLKRK